jgi:hypothetical protein
MSELVRIITTDNQAIRNRSLDSFCRHASMAQLLSECSALESFRRQSSNLYESVRALFFLYAIHTFHLPNKPGMRQRGLIPFEGYSNLLRRRFEEAIEIFLQSAARDGFSDGISSALAEAYHKLAFQTLADQVRRSVRSAHGNQWMFRIGHPADHPLRIRPRLLQATSRGLFPILHESTPVRMDLTHSGWSDIFFLGMDFPAGARVLNISIDLCVKGTGQTEPRPPIETFLRVIDRPVLRLVSVDLGAVTEIASIEEIFDFAKDYLGLLKAAVIASGIVPPGMEGSGQPLTELLERLIKPGHGLELVSQVNGIPKGSRLAVSTNLLASLIAVCMRATGQTRSLTGPLVEGERRVVAARAILGEWLGGSGGGWQDSGGIWPGMKVIEGVEAGENDPEFGISRGRLLPHHTILDETQVSGETRQLLQDSLVLVHGGMAQDVGPILEMVTEKYLLRSEDEWHARQEAIGFLDQIVGHLRTGEVKKIGRTTQRNFDGPIQTIIPWASNLFTETIIRQVRSALGDDFYGFWMLGGMSGGGMGFICEPRRKLETQQLLRQVMSETKQRLDHALPFAIDPVVYDFRINETGTCATLHDADAALMKSGYYTLIVPALLRKERRQLTTSERSELATFGSACRHETELTGAIQDLFDNLLPGSEAHEGEVKSLTELLVEYGFDKVQHEEIRADLRSGRIGLAQNRLPVSSNITDVQPEEIIDVTSGADPRLQNIGQKALADGQAAVVSFAGGAGSRWTHGAGVVKALNPFCKLGGRHRTFIGVHLAKSRKTSNTSGAGVPHIVTTSYLTHEPIRAYLEARKNYNYRGPLYLSPGRIVGLRLVPMARDMRFVWEEMPQQLLDEQAQKVRESLHAALIGWAQKVGEGSDYTDNLPLQCLHPVGHWFEIPNLFLNGTLARLLKENPGVRHLLVHNIDTVGTNLDPGLLGLHIESGAAWTSEVITRRIEDRGGGLAKLNGQIRLIEGLALPREEVEFKLSYYNTGTSWLHIDGLLEVFGLTRGMLADQLKVAEAVRSVAARMPTYITLKDVKKRWGRGQEDIYPVTQFEKLWGDMTALPEMKCQYVVVSRFRGQQLKETAQLDGWVRNGSAAFVEGLCDWEDEG